VPYFHAVLALSVLSVTLEGLVFDGTLGTGVGYAGTYLRILVILALLGAGRKKAAAVVYLTFLGSAVTEVNFLQDQGFITASAFVNLPGFQALRVPGLPVGWSTLLGFIILISAFQHQKKDALFRAKFRVFLLFLAFGASALAFSVLSYLGGTFSDELFAKDLNRFMISMFAFGLLFLNFTKKEVIGIILGITIGTLLTAAVLFYVGVTRMYAGSLVAISVPAHAYIFLIALLVPGIGVTLRTLVLLLIIGLVVVSGFLISGKTIISLILLVVLVFANLFSRRLSPKLRLAAVLVILGPFLFLDFNSIGTFFINQGDELAGRKIMQLSFLGVFPDLGDADFFNSSGGNVVAEALTIGAMLLGTIPEHLPLVGLGFGGQIVDHFEILTLANADSYPEEAFKSGRFSGMHLAIFGYLFWGGIAGIALVWTITIRYILPSKEVWLTWSMFMSFWIFGLSDKFDASFFALLLSGVMAEMVDRQLVRPMKPSFRNFPFLKQASR
jgi:hypothetical protein